MPTVKMTTAMVFIKKRALWTSKCNTHTHTHLHESLQLEELAMQIFKVLLEKVPEPVIKHDLDQHTERLLLWHLKEKTKIFKKSCQD